MLISEYSNWVNIGSELVVLQQERLCKNSVIHEKNVAYVHFINSRITGKELYLLLHLIANLLSKYPVSWLTMSQLTQTSYLITADSCARWMKAMSPASMQLPTMNNWDMGPQNSPYSNMPPASGRVSLSKYNVSESWIEKNCFSMKVCVLWFILTIKLTVTACSCNIRLKSSCCPCFRAPILHKEKKEVISVSFLQTVLSDLYSLMFLTFCLIVLFAFYRSTILIR